MAVAVQLAPAEVSQTQVLKRLVQLMVKQLVLSGSGQFQQQVMDFQRAWNGYAAVFAKVQPAIVTPSDVCYRAGDRVRHFVLDDDGQYGPKTATALYYLVGPPRPPCRASGMAAWYAANHAKIDALVEPTSYPVDVQEPQASGAMQQANVVTDVEIAQAGGTTTQQLVQTAASVPGATQSGGGATTNEEIRRESEIVTSIVSEEVTETRHADIPAESRVSFEDTPVIGRPRSGRTAAIAFAVGGVALLGVLSWAAYRHGPYRRRR